MTRMPCLVCGQPAEGNRCPDHPARPRIPARLAGYDTAWDKLSRRARRLQPFCELCGATTDLTADHRPEAWRRKAAGLPIRLSDIRVLCRGCNVKAGPARATIESTP